MTAVCHTNIREAQGVKMHAAAVQKSQFLASIAIGVEAFHEKGVVRAGELGLVEGINHLDLRVREEVPSFRYPAGRGDKLKR